MISIAQKVALKDLKGNHVLEVGFGRGEFLEALRDNNIIAEGIEISDDMVASARDRGFKASKPEDYLPEVNTVCCFETLEHQENPVGFLRGLPGTVLYLSVPNKNRMSVKVFRKFETWDYPPNHLQRFNKEELERILAEGGYGKVEVREFAVQAVDIVRLKGYFGGANVEDYDEVRGTRSKWKDLVLSILDIVLYPLAIALSIVGFKGGNLYAKAERI